MSLQSGVINPICSDWVDPCSPMFLGEPVSTSFAREGRLLLCDNTISADGAQRTALRF